MKFLQDVLGSSDVQKKVNIKSYALTHAKGLKASTSIALELNEKVFEANSSGEGQYDAFWKALNKIYKHFHKQFWSTNKDLLRLGAYSHYKDLQI